MTDRAQYRPNPPTPPHTTKSAQNRVISESTAASPGTERFHATHQGTRFGGRRADSFCLLLLYAGFYSLFVPLSRPSPSLGAPSFAKASECKPSP